MKKFLFLLLPLSLALSCSKDDNSIETEVEEAIVDYSTYTSGMIQNATLEEKLSYKRFHLLQVAKLLNNSKNQVKNRVLELSGSGKNTFAVEDLFETSNTNRHSNIV